MGRDSRSIKQIKQSVKRKGNKTTGSDIINKTKKKRKLNKERVKLFALEKKMIDDNNSLIDTDDALFVSIDTNKVTLYVCDILVYIVG